VTPLLSDGPGMAESDEFRTVVRVGFSLFACIKAGEPS